jgi:N-acetylglucosamine kinase-like BadF-type ATPase
MEYVLGFDGGGTKTEVKAVDLQGIELVTCLGKASNPKTGSIDTSLKSLTDLLDHFFNSGRFHPDECRGLCLGIAGIDNEHEISEISTGITNYFGKRDNPLFIRITNDAEIGLMAGLGQNSGIIAVAGTGAIVYGITPNGQRFRAGGWGHILGDRGSGYEIGLQTLQTIMASFDGIIQPTLLTDLVLEKHGFRSPVELRTYIYQQHIVKQHIAEHAEMCILAARRGDPAAIEIIKGAVAELAVLTKAIQRKNEWFNNSPLTMTGSILKHSELFRKTFEEQLQVICPGITAMLSDRSPSYGAAMLALRAN